MDLPNAAAAFNEWMRQYTENPERFEREVTTIKNFLADKLDGKEPTYGEMRVATLERMAAVAVESGG